MSDIMAEDIHQQVVDWGTKEEHDSRYPNCKDEHDFCTHKNKKYITDSDNDRAYWECETCHEGGEL